MPKAISKKEVAADLKRRGFKLKGEYVNTYTPVLLECSKKHVFSTRYIYLKTGSGCKICSNSRKKTHQEVEQKLKDISVKLLTPKYKSNKQKLKVQCLKCDTKYVARFDQMCNTHKLRKTNGCPECAKILRAAKRRVDLSMIEKELPKGFKIVKSPEVLKVRESNLTLKCSKGHIFEKTVNRLRLTGYNCNECSPAIGKKDKQDYLDLSKLKNITLIDPIPNSAKKPIKWKCSEGHNFKVSYIQAKGTKNPCYLCTNKSERTTSEVKKIFKSKGIEFLDREYINTRHKHNSRCLTCDHKWSINLSNVQSGFGCPACGIEKSKDKKRIDKKEIFNRLNEIGIKLITPIEEYKNSASPMIFECSKSHRFETSLNHLGRIDGETSKSKGCIICAGLKISVEDSKKEGQRIGLKLLDQEYVNANSPMTWFCKEGGHKVKADLATIKRRSSCPKCNPHDSLEHKITHPSFDAFMKPFIEENKYEYLIPDRGTDLKKYKISLNLKRPDRVLVNEKNEFIFIELKNKDKKSFNQKQIENYYKIGRRHGGRFKGLIIVSEEPDAEKNIVSFDQAIGLIKTKGL